MLPLLCTIHTQPRLEAHTVQPIQMEPMHATPETHDVLLLPAAAAPAFNRSLCWPDHSP